tara:strand:+ start:302 stop:544 length:243 start_codon:yes stop_codon:yes gene_type:complete
LPHFFLLAWFKQLKAQAVVGQHGMRYVPEWRRVQMSTQPFKGALNRRRFGLIDNFQTLSNQPCAQDEQEQNNGQRDNGGP